MGCNSSKSSAYDASPASDGAPTLTGGEALHASEVNLRLSHGGAHSAVHTHSAEELRVHAMAEKLSKQHAHSEAKIVKLLWLGAGEWRATYDNYVSLARTGTTIHSEQERKAKGVVQTNFKIKGLDFAMFHVGSQRNGRRKWIHAFDDVNAVIFVAALSDFDQVLYEDETQNRMEQAISLFDQIVNSRWFAETSFVLLLTEKDVFEQKIKRASISKHFPDYDGARRRPNLLPTIDVRVAGTAGDDSDFKAGSEFFKAKFLSKSKNKSKSIYPHVTCATDTANITFVFNAVIAIILGRPKIRT